MERTTRKGTSAAETRGAAGDFLVATPAGAGVDLDAIFDALQEGPPTAARFTAPAPRAHPVVSGALNEAYDQARAPDEH